MYLLKRLKRCASGRTLGNAKFILYDIIFVTKSWGNVRTIRATLLIFEAMSGLRVNFNKSLLVGINISDSWLHEAVAVLSCKVGKIPFVYLGLPIGGNPRRLCFWELIVNRIKNRLSSWNSRFLSCGGRLYF